MCNNRDDRTVAAIERMAAAFEGIFLKLGTEVDKSLSQLRLEATRALDARADQVIDELNQRIRQAIGLPAQMLGIDPGKAEHMTATEVLERRSRVLERIVNPPVVSHAARMRMPKLKELATYLPDGPNHRAEATNRFNEYMTGRAADAATFTAADVAHFVGFGVTVQSISQVLRRHMALEVADRGPPYSYRVKKDFRAWVEPVPVKVTPVISGAVTGRWSGR